MDHKKINSLLLSNPEIKKRVAFHEAAHFITYIAYCNKFLEYPCCEKLSILPEESPLLGYMRHRPFCVIPLIIPGFEERSRNKLMHGIKQQLAGPASDFLLCEEYKNQAEYFFNDNLVEDISGDYEESIKLAKVLFPGSEEESIQEYLFTCFLAAIEDVKLYWPFISEVGTRLFDSDLIEVEELEQMVGEYLDKLTN